MKIGYAVLEAVVFLMIKIHSVLCGRHLRVVQDKLDQTVHAVVWLWTVRIFNELVDKEGNMERENRGIIGGGVGNAGCGKP